MNPTISKLDSILQVMKDQGFKPGLSRQSYERIVATGVHTKNLPLAFVATQVALQQQPITLRGLMYQIVSSGWLPSTDKEHYNRLGRLMTGLREAGIVPFSWIVDNVRQTDKPSSWAGLKDFAQTVRRAYRKSFWGEQPDYVHVIVEKDAIAGVLSPVTREYDVSLSPIRGYVSLSFAHAIAEQWNDIDKPIHAYYLGDFDASGFDLERDLREKLARYCDHQFHWTRLALNKEDFAAYDLIPLAPKKSDRRYAKFVAQHGCDCAELDAIPANDLRERLSEAILSHIDQDAWTRLQEVERVEKESIDQLAGAWA